MRKLLILIGSFTFLFVLGLPLASAQDLSPLEQAVATRRAARLGQSIEEPTFSDPTEEVESPRQQRVTTRPSARALREAAQQRMLDRLERAERPTINIEVQQRSVLRQQVLELTNAEREKEESKALIVNARLQRAAQDYAEELWNKNFFAHEGLDGSFPKDRMQAAGYGTVTIENCACKSYRIIFGENLAKGQQSPAQAVRDWMNSPKHREALLLPDFTEIGIGIAGNVWVQNFGSIELRR